MNIFDQLLADNQIPKFVRVRHEMDHSHIDDIEGAVAQAMRREGTLDRSSPATVSALPRAAVMWPISPASSVPSAIRSSPSAHTRLSSPPWAAMPVRRPRASAASIEGYGVTEEAMGAPIRATMDTEVIAHSKSGLEIHLDK